MTQVRGIDLRPQGMFRPCAALHVIDVHHFEWLEAFIRTDLVCALYNTLAILLYFSDMLVIEGITSRVTLDLFVTVAMARVATSLLEDTHRHFLRTCLNLFILLHLR